MTRILITDGFSSDGVGILKGTAGFEVELRKATEAAELLSIIDQYDCLIVRSATTVTKEVIEKGKNLKLICRAGAGVDNIDMPAARERKVAVMNTASANSLAAAEHAVAMMFSLMRHIPQAHQSMRDQKWDKASFVGYELTGKTLGVLGLGNIGKIVADRGQGLKMKVVGYDPMVKTLPEVELKSSVLDVLKVADIVTIHLPVTKETKGMLNADTLGQMKDGSWVINCARGGLVDEEALCNLLDSGKIRGAAFDVFAAEPVKYPNRLASHPKVIVTPHLGASTHEAQTRVGLTAAQQIVGFFKSGDKTGVLA